MKEEYREAFSEVAQIINLMPSNLANKIPLRFMQIIEAEKSKTYMSNITEPIEKCQLKDETTIMLAVIYRDFLCSKEERANLIARDTNNLEEFEKKLREKYNPDNIFKNRSTTQYSKEEHQTGEMAIVEYKEKNFLQKLFDKIKHLFKRKWYIEKFT